MIYDFDKLNTFDLRTSSVAVTNYKPNRGNAAPKVMNKYWEELKLSENKETVLLLAGDYTSLVDGKQKSWLEYLLHQKLFVKGQVQKEIVCSAGIDPHNKQPCTGCVYWENGPKKENPWYPKPKVKFNILSLANYHDNVPYMKDNKPMVKEDGKPVLIKQQCAGRGCALCASLGKPSIFGRLMKLLLTGTHFTQLMTFNKKTLNNLCSGCGKTIVVNEYTCAQCNTQLLGSEAIENMSLEQVEKFAKSPQKCACDNIGFAQEGLDCGYDANGLAKESDSCPLEVPIRMNIFNTVLSLTKSGEKAKSTLSATDLRSVYPNSLIRYAAPNKMALPEILNNALGVNNGNLFNLSVEIQILSTHDQAEMLGVPDPYAENQSSLPSDVVPQSPQLSGFPVNFPTMQVR